MVHNRGFGVELTASLYPACSLHRQLLQKEVYTGYTQEFSSAHDDMNKLDTSRRAGWTRRRGQGRLDTDGYFREGCLRIETADHFTSLPSSELNKAKPQIWSRLP
ncbi:uncharacterized protein LOC123498120 [Portunus trituberculatus]|uniref:uncharacterized protein LOC123498120 n=1 Tax=Portunus trituberculatus TaxID=210409 RepID=UPI001E1CF62F|nr:uncharacterized protein LOC123498120 [Portunus trituberculatus]XP_045101231.1 uncharacterized protein LOC123498120 [Portunus trituberculatus]